MAKKIVESKGKVVYDPKDKRLCWVNKVRTAAQRRKRTDVVKKQKEVLANAIKDTGVELAEDFKDLPDDPPEFDKQPELAKLWARDKWLRGIFSNEELANAIKVPEHRIYVWISGQRNVLGWKHEREKIAEKVLKSTIRNEAQELSGLIEKMVSVVEKSVVAIVDENKRLNVNEISRMTSAIEALFKLRQLTLGRPTDIYGDAKILTWADVMEKLKKADIIDYKQLEKMEPIEVKALPESVKSE